MFKTFKSFNRGAQFKFQDWGQNLRVNARSRLTALYGFADPGDFQRAHREMIEQALQDGMTLRDDCWSEAIAVGSLTFVERVKSELGSRAIHRAVERIDGGSVLREEREAYDGDLGIKSTPLRLKNTISWDENAETA